MVSKGCPPKLQQVGHGHQDNKTRICRGSINDGQRLRPKLVLAASVYPINWGIGNLENWAVEGG